MYGQIVQLVLIIHRDPNTVVRMNCWVISGRRLSDIKGNQNIVSVKSLIKTIEGQGSLGSSTGSSRRGSSDSLGSPTTACNNHGDTTRSSPERRTSGASEAMPLKSALKKPKEEDKTRTRSIYDKTGSPVIESLRPVSSENSVSSLLSIRKYVHQYNILCVITTKSHGNNIFDCIFLHVVLYFMSSDAEHSTEKTYDPLAKLVKQTGGSKRNALLKWCQQKSIGYR